MEDDEALSLQDWHLAFSRKIPSLNLKEFEEAWNFGKLRTKAQYSWASIQSKMGQASSEDKTPVLFRTLCSSEDPSPH